MRCPRCPSGEAVVHPSGVGSCPACAHRWATDVTPLVWGIADDDGRFVRLPPPWFVPADGPACGAILDVPPQATNDGVARMFVCDRPAGHEHAPPGHEGVEARRHRHVTDVDAGTTTTWDPDANARIAERLTTAEDALAERVGRWIEETVTNQTTREDPPT